MNEEEPLFEGIPLSELTSDEPIPPGFMDRPEVKEAVEWALAQVGKKSDHPGMTSADLFKLSEDERRRMESQD